MYPILFSLFGIKFYSSIVFLVLAIIASAYVGWLEARRQGIRLRDYLIFGMTAIPFTMLFAALNALIFFGELPNALGAFNSPLGLLSDGVGSIGAVIGLLTWGFILARLTKRPVAPVLDSIAIMLPLLLGIYRIGCLLNGCCYGLETDSLIGMYLPGQAGVWAMRYPTQLMLMILDFGLFALLWQRRLKKQEPGKITFAFLIIYSSYRFLVDGLRAEPHALGNFNLHQLTFAAILLITLYFMFEFRMEKKGIGAA